MFVGKAKFDRPCLFHVRLFFNAVANPQFFWADLTTDENPTLILPLEVRTFIMDFRFDDNFNDANLILLTTLKSRDYNNR